MTIPNIRSLSRPWHIYSFSVVAPLNVSPGPPTMERYSLRDIKGDLTLTRPGWLICHGFGSENSKYCASDQASNDSESCLNVPFFLNPPAAGLQDVFLSSHALREMISQEPWKYVLYIFIPFKIDVEPQNHPLETENVLPSTSIFGFHVNCPGCINM